MCTVAVHGLFTMEYIYYTTNYMYQQIQLISEVVKTISLSPSVSCSFSFHFPQKTKMEHSKT